MYGYCTWKIVAWNTYLPAVLLCRGRKVLMPEDNPLKLADITPNYHPELLAKKISILILGGGFAGVEALRCLQNEFKKMQSVEVTLISRDNFLLFTPMLPEAAVGEVDARHIATPIRAFCKRRNIKFLQADVQEIDLVDKHVTIAVPIDYDNSTGYNQNGSYKNDGQGIAQTSSPYGVYHRILRYDYLIIALGSITKFYGMQDVEEHSFTIKNLADSLILRNHIINMLEKAEVEYNNEQLRKRLLTFVVVGGGFSGVETVGEINDFVRGSIKEYYKGMDANKDVRVILVNSHEQILPETSEELGKYALQKLKEKGIEFIPNVHASGATTDSVKLNDGKVIPTCTIVWTAGVTPDQLVKDLPCDNEKGRIKTDSYLEIEGYPGVFAIGDCASVMDPHTGKPYPPTAQIALREARVAAANLASIIKNKGNKMRSFAYKNKGFMAEIGKRNAVANIFGRNLRGTIAWMLWRSFYLSGLPTSNKKVRVISDWTIDLIFGHDVTMVKILEQRRSTLKRIEQHETQEKKHHSEESAHAMHGKKSISPKSQNEEARSARRTEAT